MLTQTSLRLQVGSGGLAGNQKAKPKRRQQGKTVGSAGENLCSNPLCLKPLDHRGASARWCSNKCRMRVKSGLTVERQCLRDDCKRMFIPRTSIQIYCSFKCQQRVQGRNWYYAHKESCNISRKKYLASHREQTRKTTLDYRARNKLRLKEKATAYYQSHRELFMQQKYLRRAREKTPKQEMGRCYRYMKSIRARKSNKCYYCKRTFTLTPHFDHVIPLSRGGLHEIGNLCVSCPSCNLSKAATLPNALAVQQPLLSL